MKIDVTQALTDYRGEEIQEPGENGEAVPMLLGNALERALTRTQPDAQKGSSMEDSVRRVSLAGRIYAAGKTKGGTAELSAEDISFVKSLAGRYYIPTVAAAIEAALEGAGGGK